MHFETQENCKKEFLDLSTRIVVCSLKVHTCYFFMNIGGGLKGSSRFSAGNPRTHTMRIFLFSRSKTQINMEYIVTKYDLLIEQISDFQIQQISVTFLQGFDLI